MATPIAQDHISRAQELHTKAVVIAGHTDICPDVAKRQRAGECDVFRSRHLRTLQAGGISAICDHVAGDAPYLIDFPFRNTTVANRLKFGLQGMASLVHEIESAPDVLVLAQTAQDIRDAKSSGKLAIVLCFEGASPFEDDINFIQTFHRLGLRQVGLTHDQRNLLGDGVRTGSAGGLTSFGKDVVRELNRLGIVVDVSHLNEAGFWDVIEVASAPVHASHSNASSLCQTPRNLSDEQLSAIASTGGVVGVHALGYLVEDGGGVPRFEAFMAHIEHMIEVMGHEHVAIGPDMMENYPEEEYALLWNDVRIPQLAFVYPTEFDSLSKFPVVTAALVERAYPDEVVIDVLGGNLMRMFARVWGS